MLYYIILKFADCFLGRVPSGRAIAQYLSGRDKQHIFKHLHTARPERILAHIPHALRLVHSADKSGDRSSSARPECLRAGKLNALPDTKLLAKTPALPFRHRHNITLQHR